MSDQPNGLDLVESSVVTLLRAGPPETPDVVLERLGEQLPGLPAESIKSELISLLNRGVIVLTLEGKLRVLRQGASRLARESSP